MSRCSFKWHKATVLIAVVALCCFVFAGTALAASKVFVEETGSSYVKAEHTYDLNIKIDGLAAPLFLFTDQYPPCSADPNTQATNKLVVDFAAFGLENDNLVVSGDTDECGNIFGPEVRAVVTVDGEKYFVPVFPEIYEAAEECSTDKSVVDRVYFTIERQFIPVDGDGIVTEVEIQGLQVKTPRNPGAYTVCISHTNAQCAFNIPCATINVVETVGRVRVNAPTGCLIAGGTLNITGDVYSTEVDAACKRIPWRHTSWPVIVEVRKATVSGVPCSDEFVTNYDYAYYQSEAVQNVDCLGYPLCFDGCSGDTVIASFIAHVAKDGKFDANIKLPTCVVGGPYVVTARTIEVADQNLDIPIEYKNSSWLKTPPAEAKEDYANALKQFPVVTNQHILRGEYTLYLQNGQEYTTLPHAWLKANDREFSVVAGEPWTIKATEMLSQINLDEKYPVTITLTDKYCNETINADPCGANRPPLKVELRAYVCDDPLKTKAGDFYLNDQKVIYAEILPGESSVAVQFKPTKTGYVTLEYASIFGNPGERRGAGDCCVEVNQEECMFDVKYLVTNDACDSEVAPRAGWPIKVSVHYPIQGDLRVELVDSKYNPIDWATWDTDLILEDGSILEFEAIGDFVSGDILTHPNHGEDNNKSVFYVYTDRNACDKSFTVKLVDEARGVKDEWLIGPYATPVDMVRVLQPDSWQILSTPKTLAGDGNLKSLMNDRKFYSDILVYEDNVWKIPNPVNDELTPLYAYYVKTKQNWCKEDCTNCGTEKPWYASYIFDRAADPVGMVDRYLESGWNFIGPSFDENVNNLLPTRFDNEWFEYDTCCDINCCSCLIPGDGEDGCSPICEDLLFQGDRLYRMVATLCGGCDLLLNPGGPGLDSFISAAEIEFWGDPNPRANLAGFSSASVSNQTLPSWAADPLYMAFNGDGYWIYLTKPGTLAAQGQIEIIAPVSPLN